MNEAMDLDTENGDDSSWYDEDLQLERSWLEEIQTDYWSAYVDYLQENGYHIEE